MANNETENERAVRYIKKVMGMGSNIPVEDQYIVRAIYEPLMGSSVLQHHKTADYYVYHFTFLSYLEHTKHLVCKYIHEDKVLLSSVYSEKYPEGEAKDVCDKAIRSHPIKYRQFILEIYYDKDVK